MNKKAHKKKSYRHMIEFRRFSNRFNALLRVNETTQHWVGAGVTRKSAYRDALRNLQRIADKDSENKHLIG